MSPVLPVLRQKIVIDDCFKRFAAPGRRGGSLHLPDFGRERARRSFGDELVLRVEVPVEPAVRQAGTFHQIGPARFADPVLTETNSSDLPHIPSPPRPFTSRP